MREIEVVVMQVDAEGKPVIDDTDYSRQDAIIQKIDPEGILSALSWKYMGADWAVALQDAQERLKAIETAAIALQADFERHYRQCPSCGCIRIPDTREWLHRRDCAVLALKAALETGQETPK